MTAAQMMEMLKTYEETENRKTAGAESRGIPSAFNISEFPPERPDEFSTSSFDFEHSAAFLWEDTQITYYHACIANRFTDDYLRLCDQLEKNIRRLGTVCLTKAVLEQKGLEFPRLEQLSITELVKMVSYHLQKSHAAFREIYVNNNYLGMSYLSREFAWFSLGCRLKATESKIGRIRDGSLNVDRLLKETEKFAGETLTDEGADQGLPRSLQTNPPALPLDKSTARKLLNMENEAETTRQPAGQKQKEALREPQHEKKTSGCGHPSPHKAKAQNVSGDPEPEVSETGSRDPSPDPAPADIPEGQPDEETMPGTITPGEAIALLIRETMNRKSPIAFPIDSG